MKRIVLAYSGGPGGLAAIKWLAEHHNADIITVTLDLGQGQDLHEVRDLALATGATRAHVLDAREEFARKHVLPSLKAQAAYGDCFPMTTALSRPLIASKLVEMAAMEQAAAVAHAERDGHPAPLDAALRALGPDVEVIAASRGQTTIPDGASRTESNLWGRSIDPGTMSERPVPEPIYTLTRDPLECPKEPASVEISFERGVPCAINGVSMPFVELVGNLAVIVGAHGVGRAPGREAPAAVVLHAAHAEMQNLVTTDDARRFARTIGQQYGELVRNGQWFTPRRETLDAFVEILQENVSGVVRLKLFKGQIGLVGPHLPDHQEGMMSR